MANNARGQNKVEGEAAGRGFHGFQPPNHPLTTPLPVHMYHVDNGEYKDQGVVVRGSDQ